MSDTSFLAGLSPTAMLLMVLLGAYHGINPAMGWLFAVARGMQERSGAAVGRSLIPIALGHGLAIAAVVFLAVFAGMVIPLTYLKTAVAAVLLGFGAYCLLRQRHPQAGGMRVGFGGLTSWSFITATAHGAGFMLLPVLLGTAEAHGHAHAGMGPQVHSLTTPAAAFLATSVHTLGYLAVTGILAWLVYWKFGLSLLRTAWINLHLIWAFALIVSAVFVLLA